MEKYPATFRWFTTNGPLQLIIIFPQDLRRYMIQLGTVLIGFLFVYNHGENKKYSFWKLSNINTL